ncbi:Ras-GEF domain-containing family member 1B [Caenorhabditis elegans]|nr:Ras-GEF domain-containing family member 1B [Caenorhabditis elegans]CDM63568.1 Ras-GEF domain-containing family member 1B [Caenorhabditis elegans]|eukprot:NP_001294202.1 Uncharacterized protein CELE_R05G6.10 [Caenorhabditis elegans]
MRRKRARSSNPNGCKTKPTTLEVDGATENNNGKLILPNSTSQPMLSTQSARGYNTLPRRAAILTSSQSQTGMISLTQQVSAVRLDTHKSDTFEQNDLVLDNTGAVLSGSRDALIRRLVPTRDFCPDESYIFSLLVNIRTFISPHELMQKIVQYCMFAQNADSHNFAKEGRGRMFAHILRLCSEWATNIPYDFKTEYMRTRLNELLRLCAVDKTYQQKTTELQSTLRSSLNKLDRYEKAVANLQKALSENTNLPEQSDSMTGLFVLCNDAKTVAQQLTHIEMERFSMVGVDEIVQSLASDPLSEIGRHSKNKEGTISSISFYIEWFNRLSAFAAIEVLKQTKKRNRVAVFEFMIDIAKECCEIGNFNSMMAIVAGLSLPAVSRLKKTWCRVEKAKLEILQHQLDPSGNFLSYRATIKAAQWRADSARGNQQKIVIPFFVLLLKDLFLIYHGHPRILPNAHLNFMAFNQLAEQLRDVIQWKSTVCTFEKNPQVLQYLLITSVSGEKDSMLMSFECEPPESSSERDQHKKLKGGK